MNPANPGTTSATAADVEAVFREARSPEDRLRRSAASRLALVRDPRAVPALVGLLSDARQSVQEAAAQALRHRGDGIVAEAMAGLLGSPDLGLRNRAGTVLASLGEVSVPVLVREATAGQSGVRKFTVEIMGEIRSPWVVGTLVKALRDEDLNVAFASAEALGKFPAPEVAECLIAVFRERRELRCPVAEALGLQADARAVPLLVEALGDPDLLLQFSAVNALGLIGSPAGLRPLMDAFRRSPDPLRHAILQAVTRLTEHIAPGSPELDQLRDILSEVLDAAGSDEWEIRRAALRILSLCPASDSSTAAVARLLGDPVEEVRQLAWKNLQRAPVDVVPALLEVLLSGPTVGRCLATELLAAQFDSRATPALLEMTGEADERIRAAAARALGQCGGREAVAPLEALTADRDVEVRQSAARALGWMRSESSGACLRALLDDEAGEVRESALGALVLISGEQVVRGLREDLRHPRPERRRLAGVALGYIGDETVVEPLLEALAHEDAGIRQSAALSLGRLQDCRAFEPLEARMEDPEPGVRQASVDALLALDLDRAVAALEGHMHDPDPWVRYHLVSTLSDRRHPSIPALLVRALQDPALVVTIAAAEALGRLGRVEAAGELVKLLDRPEPELVRCVIQSLTLLGGEEAKAALLRHEGKQGPRVL